MPITIKDLASHRLGFEASNGQHFYDAGLDILGGCAGCEASLAAYNGYPSKSGYWKCKDCIGPNGWDTVESANKDIFDA
jgi:hypothetical protein